MTEITNPEDPPDFFEGHTNSGELQDYYTEFEDPPKADFGLVVFYDKHVYVDSGSATASNPELTYNPVTDTYWYWVKKPKVRFRWGRFIYALLVAIVDLNAPLYGLDVNAYKARFMGNGIHWIEESRTEFDELTCSIIFPSLLLTPIPLPEFQGLMADNPYAAPDLRYLMCLGSIYTLAASVAAIVGIKAGPEVIHLAVSLASSGLSVYSQLQEREWKTSVTESLNEINAKLTAISGSAISGVQYQELYDNIVVILNSIGNKLRLL